MVSFAFRSDFSTEDITYEETEEDESKKCKIYISYEWKCLSKVQKIHDELIKHECFDVFMDVFQVKVGMSLLSELVTKIQETDIVLACVTRDYIKSNNCDKEINFADEFRKNIIPLYMEKIPVQELAPMGLVLARERYCELYK